MRLAQLATYSVLAVSAALAFGPTTAGAAVHKVMPGESIQDAIDAASPGDTVKVWPGDYIETHGNSAAIRITKSLKFIAKSDLKNGVKVRILPGVGNQDGILVEPPSPGVDPPVVGIKIKGFTVEGFPNHGIWLQYVENFKILENESIDNLHNGIFPTLSVRGLVKKNVSYGSLDAALWVEAAENVRVIKNELYNSPTGLEVTISKDILIKKNDVHDNTVGIGLYHPSAASLPALGGDGDWKIVGNHVHDNNFENTAPPGSLPSQLPPGGGILVLGVDRMDIQKNLIENNDFFGVAYVDWCLAVDCGSNPAVSQDEFPSDNKFHKNKLSNNGTNPSPFGGLESFADDITYVSLGGPNSANCFAKNTGNPINGFNGYQLANSCK